MCHLASRSAVFFPRPDFYGAMFQRQCCESPITEGVFARHNGGMDYRHLLPIGCKNTGKKRRQGDQNPRPCGRP
ncbi:MAG: hypothetical protein BWY09_01378 [Candidatus Hydrogenedentes bacterium ADurb.Bin179]|nr:MAG: hypothetical protein BWY09_01378 [Candidatus Hydrogenedentes bacterium ADurb.Bin179]